MADNKMTDKSLKEKVLDNRLVRSIITVVSVMCVAFIILLVKINIDNKDARSSVVTEDFISGQPLLKSYMTGSLKWKMTAAYLRKNFM